MGMDEIPKVGDMPRGQAWVELHGIFTVEKLKELVSQLEKNLVGTERKPNVCQR